MFWLINKFGRVAVMATFFLFGSLKIISIFADVFSQVAELVDANSVSVKINTKP